MFIDVLYNKVQKSDNQWNNKKKYIYIYICFIFLFSANYFIANYHQV